MKKFLFWVVFVIVLIWVLHNPTQAGAGIRTAFDHITAFATSL